MNHLNFLIACNADSRIIGTVNVFIDEDGVNTFTDTITKMSFCLDLDLECLLTSLLFDFDTDF